MRFKSAPDQRVTIQRQDQMMKIPSYRDGICPIDSPDIFQEIQHAYYGRYAVVVFAYHQFNQQTNIKPIKEFAVAISETLLGSRDMSHCISKAVTALNAMRMTSV